MHKEKNRRRGLCFAYIDMQSLLNASAAKPDSRPYGVFDFADSRGGQHARDFVDLPGAPARSSSQGFGQLYEVVRSLAHVNSTAGRQARKAARSVADALHQWLGQQRQRVPDGSATARATDYSLRRLAALPRCLDNDDLPIDDNWVENRIRPITLGRQDWLLAGSLRVGKRAAAVVPLGQAQRPWLVCLPVLRAGAAADAAGQSHCRVAAASLAANDLMPARQGRFPSRAGEDGNLHRLAAANVKAGSTDAYGRQTPAPLRPGTIT